MKTGNNTVSSNHTKSDAMSQTSQQYNHSNCLLGQLHNNFDLEKSEGYNILKDFIDEFGIDLSTGSEKDPIDFTTDDIHTAERFISVQKQPFEIRPEENFEKVIHVGDIHGDFKSVYKVLLVFFREQMFNSNIAIVFTGDYIDRGNDSILCLLLVATFMKKCVKNIFFLKGNHETNGVAFYNKYDPKRPITESAMKYFINTLPATAILTVNGLKTMFIHGTPIVDEERRKEVLNDDFKWFGIDHVAMDAILANTKEELEKIVNDFIVHECSMISKQFANPQEVSIYEKFVKSFNEYVESAKKVQNELYALDMPTLDELFEWEEQTRQFMDFLKELDITDIFKDIHADYNKEEWNRFIEESTLENLPTEDIIIRLPKETFEEVSHECQEFIRKVSEFTEKSEIMFRKVRDGNRYKSIKGEIYLKIHNICCKAALIVSNAKSYHNMMFKAANGIHQKIPRENFEKAIKKHVNEELTFKEIITLEKKEIARRTLSIDSGEMFWGDVEESFKDNTICMYSGRYSSSPRLVDKYMSSNGISILFRGHQCPEHNGWDVFINGKISENEEEDFVEQNGIKKVFTKKLTEGDKMISTCHTSEVYEEQAPRTFIVTNGLTVEAYRII